MIGQVLCLERIALLHSLVSRNLVVLQFACVRHTALMGLLKTAACNRGTQAFPL